MSTKSEVFTFIRERFAPGVIAAVTREENTITLRTSRPGIVIGRQGVVAEQLIADLRATFGAEVELRIVEVKSVDLEAVLIADAIGMSLTRGAQVERTLTIRVGQAMRAGALGCSAVVSGDVSGALSEGTVDQSSCESFTVSGEVIPVPREGPLPRFTVQVSLSLR